MPRTARASVGNMCYHVLNRGNGRATVFHQAGDYAAFLDLIAAADKRLPIRILSYALLPNHFHLVLWPHEDGDLSRWMQWLLTSHVRRYHRHYQGTGHIWQGRFKAFPIERDEHLLAVLRYVERNPLRAGLVERAEDWPWSSIAWRTKGMRPRMLSKWPIPCPSNWLEHVNSAQSPAELVSLRKSVARGTPFGCEEWVERTASKLGLESTLRERGRPRSNEKGDILLFGEK
jgi:putative transposase